MVAPGPRPAIACPELVEGPWPGLFPSQRAGTLSLAAPRDSFLRSPPGFLDSEIPQSDIRDPKSDRAFFTIQRRRPTTCSIVLHGEFISQLVAEEIGIPGLPDSEIPQSEIRNQIGSD